MNYSHTHQLSASGVVQGADIFCHSSVFDLSDLGWGGVYVREINRAERSVLIDLNNTTEYKPALKISFKPSSKYIT